MASAHPKAVDKAPRYADMFAAMGNEARLRIMQLAAVAPS